MTGVAGLGRRFELVYRATVIDQRCIFHKLKNVSAACRKELKGDKHKEERKQLLQQASAVYEAESAQQAKEQRAAWAARWRNKAPESVATLEREFEATIAYFQLEGLPREWVRTTSLLERVNRQLRRKVRQALSFGSHTGAELALYLLFHRLHAHCADECWWETAHALSFDLAKDNP